MKTLGKSKKILAAAITALAFSGSATAAGFDLSEWTIDFAAVDGIGASNIGGSNTVSGIGELNFLAIGTSMTNDANSNGLPDVGETFETTASGNITQISNTSSAAIDPLGFKQAFDAPTAAAIGNSFEMTFTFEVGGVFTAVDANDANFTHLAAGQGGTTGELKFYIDNTTNDAVVDLDANTGSDDGIHVATFEILAGDGGVFNFLTADGSDDATFAMTYALAGVWFDKNDLDLSDNLGAILGFTDSNFDANADNSTAPFDFDPSGHNCQAKDAVQFCFKEDGSFNLAENDVPEPTTIALLGLGLFGLAGHIRRRG